VPPKVGTKQQGLNQEVKQKQKVKSITNAQRMRLRRVYMKSGKHEKCHGIFRVFGLSCFRDK
jgi:hypothetical protein